MSANRPDEEGHTAARWAGSEIPVDGVRSVAQRRRFSGEQILGFLRSQAPVALTRAAPPAVAGAIVDAAIESKERLKRFNGTYDQTFVRLEILARRAQRGATERPAHR